MLAKFPSFLVNYRWILPSPPDIVISFHNQVIGIIKTINFRGVLLQNGEGCFFGSYYTEVYLECSSLTLMFYSFKLFVFTNSLIFMDLRYKHKDSRAKKLVWITHMPITFRNTYPPSVPCTKSFSFLMSMIFSWSSITIFVQFHL